eukprot:TRINITY_DN13851_c0_g2_i1.p1 TRINITY_DN13851_c0_g2~~TRINITY_DN13851_c0_g2_i1.p1  ORF type:complete len:126 (-),score=17.49 TRINITY_DN13851_c0_g2_i1:104-481(-)
MAPPFTMRDDFLKVESPRQSHARRENERIAIDNGHLIRRLKNLKGNIQTAAIIENFQIHQKIQEDRKRLKEFRANYLQRNLSPPKEKGTFFEPSTRVMRTFRLEPISPDHLAPPRDDYNGLSFLV